MLSGKSRLKRPDGVVSRVISGQAVAMTVSDSTVHTFNEVGTFIFAALETARTVEELVAAVTGEFEVPPEQAERDVREFAEELQKRGLIAVDEDPDA